MFANENSINNLESLVKEIKKYIELQGQYIKLDIVEKLTVLLSTLILVLILIVLGMMALFYFSFMLVYALEPVVGSLIGAYAVIGGVILLLGAAVYRMRKQWIFRPIVNFLAKLFLEDTTEKERTMNEIKEMMPAQYSVQLISQLRAKKKQELKESKERILSLTQELFTPQQSKKQGGKPHAAHQCRNRRIRRHTDGDDDTETHPRVLQPEKEIRTGRTCPDRKETRRSAHQNTEPRKHRVSLQRMTKQTLCVSVASLVTQRQTTQYSNYNKDKT